MSALDLLDDYLGRDHSPNYWADEGIVVCMEWLNDLSDEDWKVLAGLQGSRPAGWQERFAELLSEADHERALPILREILTAAERPTALAAADSLRTIVSQHPPARLDAETARRLETLAEDEAGIAGDSLRRFLAGVEVEG